MLHSIICRQCRTLFGVSKHRACTVDLQRMWHKESQIVVRTGHRSITSLKSCTTSLGVEGNREQEHVFSDSRDEKRMKTEHERDYQLLCDLRGNEPITRASYVLYFQLFNNCFVNCETELQIWWTLTKWFRVKLFIYKIEPIKYINSE